MKNKPFSSIFQHPVFKNFLIKFLVGMLLVFTGWRTVDLVSKTLPAEAYILAFIAVISFDGGIIAWRRFASHGAKATLQVWIAGGMAIADFVGMGILFVAHILLNERFYVQSVGMITILGTVSIWTIAVGVLANIGALLAVDYFDPEEEMKRARRDMEIEIKKRSVVLVNEQNDSMANEIAPSLAHDTIEGVRSSMMRRPLLQGPPTQQYRPTYQPQRSPEPQVQVQEQLSIRETNEDYPVPIAPKPVRSESYQQDRRNGESPEDTKNLGKGWTQSELG